MTLSAEHMELLRQAAFVLERNVHASAALEGVIVSMVGGGRAPSYAELREETLEAKFAIDRLVAVAKGQL